MFYLFQFQLSVRGPNERPFFGLLSEDILLPKRRYTPKLSVTNDRVRYKFFRVLMCFHASVRPQKMDKFPFLFFF